MKTTSHLPKLGLVAALILAGTAQSQAITSTAGSVTFDGDIGFSGPVTLSDTSYIYAQAIENGDTVFNQDTLFAEASKNWAYGGGQINLSGSPSVSLLATSAAQIPTPIPGNNEASAQGYLSLQRIVVTPSVGVVGSIVGGGQFSGTLESDAYTTSLLTEVTFAVKVYEGDGFGTPEVFSSFHTLTRTLGDGLGSTTGFSYDLDATSGSFNLEADKTYTIDFLLVSDSKASSNVPGVPDAGSTSLLLAGALGGLVQFRRFARKG